MSDSPIRLVCFDLGGVLIRICRSWEEGCRAAGLDVRYGANGSGATGGAGWYASPDVTNLCQAGQISCDEFARRCSAATGNAYTPEEIMAVHDAWLLEEYPGVGDVVDRIHARGLETAALSNTNHAHWIRMPEFPAVMRLNSRFASHELGMFKPDPSIFREFEKRVNRRGDDILFFDDLPDNIQAARAIGWLAELIDPHGRTDLQIESALRRHGML